MPPGKTCQLFCEAGTASKSVSQDKGASTFCSPESPLANPLALPIALASDGVVLCVRRGHDRLASVRETIHAVGANRVICCVLFD